MIFSERKVDGRRFLFDASQGSEAIEQPDVLDAGTVVGEDGQRLQFLPSSLTQIEKLPLPVYAEETPAQEVGGDARGAAPGEGVENPSPGLCRGEDDAGQQGERFLRGVLALRLLPSGDGRKSPHVGHLLALVEELHQLVVVEMRHLLLLASPDDELGGVGEVSARDVGRWIGLRPGDDVEDFEAELCEFVGYGEDVVVSARHPDGAVFLEMVSASRQPFLVELVDVLGRSALVPVAFIDAHHLSALHADAAVGEEVGWVGENHVKLEVELSQQADAVAL